MVIDVLASCLRVTNEGLKLSSQIYASLAALLRLLLLSLVPQAFDKAYQAHQFDYGQTTETKLLTNVSYDLAQ